MGCRWADHDVGTPLLDRRRLAMHRPGGSARGMACGAPADVPRWRADGGQAPDDSDAARAAGSRRHVPAARTTVARRPASLHRPLRSDELYNLVVDGSHIFQADGFPVSGFAHDDDFDYTCWERLVPVHTR
jgi:hypothetical protein